MSTQTLKPALIQKALVNASGVAYANYNVVIQDQTSNQPMRIYSDATGTAVTSKHGNASTDSNGLLTAYVPAGRVCKIIVYFAGSQVVDTFYDVSPGDPSDLNTLTIAEVGRTRANSGLDYVVVPTTGTTVQIPDNCNTYVLNQSATVATLTINMPLNPTNRQGVWISVPQAAVTSATVTATGTGQTLKGATITTLAVNASVFWEWNTTTGFWLRCI